MLIFCCCSFKKLVNFTNNNKLFIWCQNNIYFGAFCQILDFLDQYSAFINRLRIKLDWKIQKRQNIKIFSVIILKKAKKCEKLSIKAWKFGISIRKGYIKTAILRKIIVIIYVWSKLQGRKLLMTSTWIIISIIFTDHNETSINSRNHSTKHFVIILSMFLLQL